MNCGGNRPSIDLYYMRMARLVATRSTCLRRAVGCVLVDKFGRVLSTGYNGVARGELHCNEPMKHPDLNTKGPAGIIPVVSYPNACAGASSSSGTNLSECAAIHAEQNALIQCRNADDICTCYVTVSPCDSCLKLFMNTSCRRIVVEGWYAQTEAQTCERWNKDGRIIVMLDNQ